MNMTFNNGFEYLKSLLANRNKDKLFIIAIDGRAASGKTTLASELSRVDDIPVLHTDDFFKPRNNYSRLEMTEFDGNFDIGRFHKEAVFGMLSREEFEIGIYDCKKGSISETVLYKPSDCFIVEGAYSLNPQLGEYADLRIFVDIDKQLQKTRIISRNGIDGYKRFESVWIPAEERYFSYYKIRDSVDLIISQDNGDCNGKL